MKRLRSYINSRRDEKRPEKNSRQPSEVPIRNNDFKFLNSEALDTANAAVHPFEPLYHPASNSLRINTNPPLPSSESSSPPPTKLRKPAPKYSGSSIVVPSTFPVSELAAASTPTPDTIRTHGRSKSVRIVVPEDAVFGNASRGRSISSPNTNRFEGGWHNSFSGSAVGNNGNRLHVFIPRQEPVASVLEAVPEHGDEEDADHAFDIVQSSFSDSETGYSQDDREEDVKEWDERDDNLETTTTETQSVETNHESIRLDILDNLATFDEPGDTTYPTGHPVSLVPSWSDIRRPLNIRPKPSASTLIPLSVDEINLGESRVISSIEDDEEDDGTTAPVPLLVSINGGNPHTPESSSDSATTLEDARPQSHPQHRHSHSYPAACPRSVVDGPSYALPSNVNYTSLLEGMSCVISLGGTEYLIVMESHLGRPEVQGTIPTHLGGVRARVVGGGPRRLFPDAYLVMFVEGEECLVRIVRELGGDHVDPLHTPNSVSFTKSEAKDMENSYRIPWRPGMHITVTLAGNTFLVVQVERLQCLWTSSSSSKQGADLNSGSDDFDDSSLVQIAGINSGWWTPPETGRHVVLIFVSENRRQEYLVRVVRRLPRPPSGSKSRPVSMDNSDKRVVVPRSRFSRSPQHSVQVMALDPATLARPPVPVPDRLPPSPPKNSVLVLARGYRYLTTASDGSLRFELLLEDRTNDLYASYMLPRLSDDNGDDVCMPATWVVSGGQSHHDASWVFKKDGKPIVAPGIDAQGNRRAGGSESSASADLPHHFSFKRETPSDAWVFKPAFGSSGIQSQCDSPSSESPLPNLDKLLSDGGSTFRSDSGITIFVSRLVLRKDRGMVVFHLSPASKEQVRELGRRVRAKRQEAKLEMERQLQGRPELADGRWCNLSGPEGKITDEVTSEESSHLNAHQSLRSASEDLSQSRQDIADELRQSRSNAMEPQGEPTSSSIRILRYGSHGELIFAPWYTGRLQSSSSQAEVPTTIRLPSSSKTSGTGEFLVYSHPDSESNDVTPRYSYVFYPADHNDLIVETAGRPNTMRKFTFKTHHDSDAWMFMPFGDDAANIDRLSLATRPPASINSVAGVLFQASMDDAGKITLVRLPIKSSLKAGLYASISGIPKPTWGRTHSASGSIGSVKSESHAFRHRRPRPEQLSMKEFKFPSFTRSVAIENRPTSSSDSTDPRP